MSRCSLNVCEVHFECMGTWPPCFMQVLKFSNSTSKCIVMQLGPLRLSVCAKSPGKSIPASNLCSYTVQKCCDRFARIPAAAHPGGRPFAKLWDNCGLIWTKSDVSQALLGAEDVQIKHPGGDGSRAKLWALEVPHAHFTKRRRWCCWKSIDTLSAATVRRVVPQHTRHRALSVL